MGKKRENKFRKAVTHLKSSRIDERLEVLNEIPANSTMGIYTIEPGSTTEPEVSGVDLEPDFTQDDSATDTTGLFAADGTILTAEPPLTDASPDRSYILGPMASMWYSWGNFTQIGYVRESDRKMVNLGRITGELQNWDKENGFTSYGQLTLEQAVWFCNTPKYQNGYANYRAFYPGPPSNAPDEFGRYYCTITGTPKSTRVDPFPDTTPPTQGNPDDAGYPWGLFGGNPRKKRGDTQIAAEYPKDDPLDKLLKDIKDADKRMGPSRDPGRPGKGRGMGDVWNPRAQNNKNKGDTLIAGTRNSSGRSNIPASESPRGPATPIKNYGTDAKPNFMPSGPVIDPWSPKLVNNKNKRKTQVAHYEPKGEVLSENRKRILRDIKKPYVLPEAKKEKYKFKKADKVRAKLGRTINPDMMKQAEVPTSFKKIEDKMWGKYEKKRNIKASQDKKNVVLDHLGGTDHVLEYVLETGREKGNKIVYGNFGAKAPKKVVRKEQLKGDNLLFIADENGRKETILQSEINDKLDQEHSKELFAMYVEPNKPLYEKLKRRLTE